MYLRRPIFEDSPMYAFHHAAHAYFREFVLHETFPCIAAQSAVKTDKYVFAAYHSMRSPNVGAALFADLQKYKKEFQLANAPKKDGPTFITFVAAFQQEIEDAQDGVYSLYTVLKQLADTTANWDPHVSSDTESSDFGMSIGGEAFFVPFLHQYSGSPYRRSSIPMMVFNAHSIFTKLRMIESFQKLKMKIRARQKWLHPHLGDHGDMLEFIQYALVAPDEKNMQMERFWREQLLGTKPFTQDNEPKQC